MNKEYDYTEEPYGDPMTWILSSAPLHPRVPTWLQDTPSPIIERRTEQEIHTYIFHSQAVGGELLVELKEYHHQARPTVRHKWRTMQHPHRSGWGGRWGGWNAAGIHVAYAEPDVPDDVLAEAMKHYQPRYIDDFTRMLVREGEKLDALFGNALALTEQALEDAAA